MIYTAIFQNAETGDFSRAVVFGASFNRQEAWLRTLNSVHGVILCVKINTRGKNEQPGYSQRT
jgi:hypothetical protein